MLAPAMPGVAATTPMARRNEAAVAEPDAANGLASRGGGGDGPHPETPTGACDEPAW